jgi:hypothetical protein
MVFNYHGNLCSNIYTFYHQVELFLRKKEDLFGQFYDLAAEIEEKEGVEVTQAFPYP